MLPVAANHRPFRLRFNIPGQQNALFTVINTHHAGAIIPLRCRSRQRPERAKG
jgi:hypothetical protein